MTLQAKYNKLGKNCFNLLTIDPNPPHDLTLFSLFLRLENTHAQSPQPMTYQGRVVRKRVSIGSKSEHEAIVLVSPDGQEYKLCRQECNPFRDSELDVLEGKRIECEGILRDGLLIMTRWSVLR